MIKQQLKPLYLALVAIVFLLGGCGYPKVSTQSYEYAKAIYRVTNQQDASKIEPVRKLILAAEESGEIQASESELLTGLLDDAVAGKWKSSNQAARKLMLAQVEE